MKKIWTFLNRRIWAVWAATSVLWLLDTIVALKAHRPWDVAFTVLACIAAGGNSLVTWLQRDR